jgi:ParB family transcriptional regulator, chromosome partitioning protein
MTSPAPILPARTGDLIPLCDIRPSSTNPRKNFSGPEFDELVASVKEHGILQPVLLRPRAQGYELVAGERRYRAAQKAGLKDIPAVFRDLTDEQAIELQIVENLQRQDVTALEEAQGYIALLEARSKSATKVSRQEQIEEIAKKVGKSVRYVYARMKLAGLAPEVKEAVSAGRIEVSHADELARLPLANQKKALTHCFGYGEDAKGNWGPGNVTLPVRKLKAELARGFTADLAKAPWKLDEVLKLHAKSAGREIPCVGCHYNTPSENGGASCGDTACFAAKQTAFVQIQIDKAFTQAVAEHDPKSPLNPSVVKLSESYSPREKGVTGCGGWVAAKKGSCKLYKIGVVVDGEHAGRVERACLAPGCKIHRKTSGRVVAAHSKPKSPAAIEAKKAARDAKLAGAAAVFAAIVGKVKDISGVVLDLLIEQQFQIGDAGDESLIAKQLGWQLEGKRNYGELETYYKKHSSKLTPEHKARLLVALFFCMSVEWGDRELDKAASRLKLDFKKLRSAASTASLQEAKEKAKAPIPEPAKKAAKKAGRK